MPHRIFFALETDARLQASIGDWMKLVLPKEAKPVQMVDLHITLKFIGSVSDLQLNEIVEVAEELKSDCFDLRLDTLGYWQEPQVFWLGPTEQPQPLLDMVSNLNQLLAQHCEIAPDWRPYRAHITLARKVKVKPLITPPLPMLMQVRSFSLMASSSSPEGAKYRRLKGWALAG